MVNNFLSEKCLQEKFWPKWAECFIHVLDAILLVEVGLNKFFFFVHFPSLGYQLAD
jgi:hypothetical protein